MRSRFFDWRALGARTRAYGGETRGAAAVEFALWATILVWPILNVIDFGFYVYQGMELGNATQAAAQAAWTQCSSSRLVSGTLLPAATNCMTSANLQAKLTAAVQSTSLGTGAVLKQTTLATDSTEGYYCTDRTGVLHIPAVAGPWLLKAGASTSSAPATCSSVVTGSTTVPGDYVRIVATYAYTPVFRGVTLAGALGTITKTSWIRLSYD